MTRAAYLELIGKHARKNDEDALQRSLVEHLRLRARPSIIWWHTPNAPRSKATGARLKAMGMLAGVPDLTFIIPVPGEPPAVCFLELKVGKNKLSDGQTEFAKRCEAIGVECASVWGIDQALAVLTAWGILPEEEL